MENASKALLIAAGVLIVILLIAFGMSVFNSTGDTSADAEAVGTEITSETTSAKKKAIFSMIDIKDDKAFNDYLINNYSGTITGKEVKELCDIVIKRTKESKGTGYVYATDLTHITSQNSYSIYCMLHNQSVIGLDGIDYNADYEVSFELSYGATSMYGGKVYSVLIKKK